MDHFDGSTRVLTSEGIQPPGFSTVSNQKVVEIVRRIVASLHPHKIVLFGSFAYGSPTSDSDLDLLVVMETDARPVDRITSVSRLIRPRPFPVDILVRTPEEIHEALSGRDRFIEEVMTRGKVLYERE
jgi:predicted nucleotidyltransferase